MSPALAGGFFTTEPPGKPSSYIGLVKTHVDRAPPNWPGWRWGSYSEPPHIFANRGAVVWPNPYPKKEALQAQAGRLRRGFLLS